MSIQGELQALEAIFCEKDDEFVVEIEGWKNDQSTIFSLSIKNTDNTGGTVAVKCAFIIKPEYPSVLPEVSFSSAEIPNKSLCSLKADVASYCETLKGTPMLLDVLLWVKENIENYFTISEKILDDDATACPLKKFVTTLFKLDHMRAKSKYLKTLEKWSTELDIAVYILFQDKRIMIILQGEEMNVKEFTVRQKTVNIDVDSKGRSCKERMLTFLTQIPYSEGQQRLRGFQVKEFNSAQETEELFQEIGLKEHYYIVR